MLLVSAGIVAGFSTVVGTGLVAGLVTVTGTSGLTTVTGVDGLSAWAGRMLRAATKATDVPKDAARIEMSPWF
jgi:hypothetical protein